MTSQIHNAETVETSAGLERVYLTEGGKEVTRVRINPRVDVAALDLLVRECVDTGKPVAVSLADAAQHGLCGLAVPPPLAESLVYLGPDCFADPDRVSAALASVHREY